MKKHTVVRDVAKSVVLWGVAASLLFGFLYGISALYFTEGTVYELMSSETWKSSNAEAQPALIRSLTGFVQLAWLRAFAAVEVVAVVWLVFMVSRRIHAPGQTVAYQLGWWLTWLAAVAVVSIVAANEFLVPTGTTTQLNAAARIRHFGAAVLFGVAAFWFTTLFAISPVARPVVPGASKIRIPIWWRL